MTTGRPTYGAIDGAELDHMMPTESRFMMDRPLFGEASTRDRMFNLVSGGLTCLLVLVTLLGAFIKSDANGGHKGFNIYFAVCILLMCLTHGILIYWYKQGDIDPKFRFLIYANTFIIILLCICANLYIYS